jgi:threonylcarbamoyladenosine tRNA methylthiotransferase MtaB
MPLRVAITTLGCKVNQYDSAAIETALRSEGCEVVRFGPGADVYVVNSCTVTDRADAESRQLARRARRWNPLARVVMTGCFAQVNPVRAAIPEVDHVIGLNRLPEVIRGVQGDLEERICVNDLRTARRVRTIGADSFTGQTRAFLKVQEGCDLFCTFCIVPSARGASRSLPPRQVLQQLDVLIARGFQEVVLTGVHLGGYGADLSPRLELSDLVEMLLERGGVPRLRLSSIDPPELTPRLLRLFGQSPQLCPHVHIPVQAAEDSVLVAMRRKYDTAFMTDLTQRVREELPLAAIGTDVIAGFPGESEFAFEVGLERLAALPFTYFHVFPYSKRSGTTAAKRSDHLPQAVVRQRAARLRRLGEAKRLEFARRHVGETVSVLVEDQLAPDGSCLGYSRNYQRVEFPGDDSWVNREVPVRISGVRDGRLQGARVDVSRGQP